MLTGIFHPTDFSPASEVAFVHALKLAQATQGELTVLHFSQAHGDYAEDDAGGFPKVRETLVRWGLLPADSPRETVAALGLRVRKLEVFGDDPTDTIAAYLEDHPSDLMVLATHQRSGVARWLNHEVALPLVSRSIMAALFMPPGVPGFVDFDSGHVQLGRILFPMDQHPHPRPVIETLSTLVRAFYTAPVDV